MGRRVKKDTVDNIKEEIEQEIKECDDQIESGVDLVNPKKLKKQNLLGFGSTIFNLYSSGTPFGAFLKGRYYHVIGESGSGKTWISMGLFAEAMLHSRFKKYRFIYDDKERGANMDWDFYFGSETSEKIEAPEPDRLVTVKDEKGKPTGKKIAQPYSNTVEEFFDSVNRQLDICERDGVGMIYVLDSLDSLTSEAELKKASENRKAREQEKETTGFMADGKAKAGSVGLRQVVARLEQTGSFLIVISQERDNLASPVGGKTFSGGRAWPFYSTSSLWLKKKDLIEVSYRGKKRPIGNRTKIKITKNRLRGGQDSNLMMSIYYNFGLDDIGGMIDWLIEENHWKAGATATSTFDAPEFGQNKVTREDLSRYIDENDLKPELEKIVFEVWEDIRIFLNKKVVRKRRYK